jgi:hypothetical protein
VATFSKVELPYAFKLLEQELQSYLNMGLRLVTDNDLKGFRRPVSQEMTEEQERAALEAVLPARVLPEAVVPEVLEAAAEVEVNEFDLAALGAADIRGALVAAEEGEEEGAAGAGAPAAAAAAPAPAANASGLVLQIQPNAGAPAAAAAAAAPGELEEATLDDVPYAVGAAGAAPFPLTAPGAGAPPPGTVNVQTGNQPFLIVPMSVGAPAAAPTELIAPPAYGAPATLAVDTGAAAMNAANLQPTPLRGQAARSNSAGRRMGGPAAPGGAPSVSVSKMGTSAGVAAANANPNVRVTVNKTG